MRNVNRLEWENYFSLELDWPCHSTPKCVALSMPKCALELLNKLQHPAPRKPQHSPAKHAIPTCSSKT